MPPARPGSRSSDNTPPNRLLPCRPPWDCRRSLADWGAKDSPVGEWLSVAPLDRTAHAGDLLGRAAPGVGHLAHRLEEFAPGAGHERRARGVQPAAVLQF